MIHPYYLGLAQEAQLATRKASYVAAPKGGDGEWYVVGPRGDAKTFRSSSSGQFVTRVMSNDAYKSASGKANTAIKEALKHPPTITVRSSKKK